jgi:cytochrome oxidase Cu insertion factor (SCO1/SenC/PrrC family)
MRAAPLRLLALLTLVGALLAPASPGWGHGDELRDRPPPVQADFVPPAPGTYTLYPIMRAPSGVVVDLDGRSRPLAEFTTGKITLLSFVYTRCRDAWGCPLAYRVFDAVGAAVERSPALRSRVRLVTLSFDPGHDTPTVMRQYAGEQAARGVDWRFLTTRSEHAILPLLEGFGQDVRAAGTGRPDEAGQLTHLLKVFLIDPRGVVREIYSTAYLYPEVVVADIETLRLESASREKAPASRAAGKRLTPGERLTR